MDYSEKQALYRDLKMRICMKWLLAKNLVGGAISKTFQFSSITINQGSWYGPQVVLCLVVMSSVADASAIYFNFVIELCILCGQVWQGTSLASLNHKVFSVFDRLPYCSRSGQSFYLSKTAHFAGSCRDFGRVFWSLIVWFARLKTWASYDRWYSAFWHWYEVMSILFCVGAWINLHWP